MRHLDEEQLAGLALGEPDRLRISERAHLLVCRHCRARLAGLRSLVATGRAGRPYEVRAPQPSVLAAIQAEVAGDTAPSPLFEQTLTSPAPRTARRRPAVHRAVPRLVAAAVVLAVGVGGTLWYRAAADDVLASATLTPLPDKTGQGQAELVRRDGVDELVLDVSIPAPSNAFEELWLINTDGRRMISLGIVAPDGRGRYPVPPAAAGVGGYTIVDISIEPYDGNVTHSRNSVLRGTLS